MGRAAIPGQAIGRPGSQRIREAGMRRINRKCLPPLSGESERRGVNATLRNYGAMNY
jgi:hypothetical protein